jgi:hypothetical protein
VGLQPAPAAAAAAAGGVLLFPAVPEAGLKAVLEPLPGWELEAGRALSGLKDCTDCAIEVRRDCCALDCGLCWASSAAAEDATKPGPFRL